MLSINGFSRIEMLIAFAGVGHDLASVSGQKDQQNFIQVYNSSFFAASTDYMSVTESLLTAFEYEICNELAFYLVMASQVNTVSVSASSDATQTIIQRRTSEANKQASEGNDGRDYSIILTSGETLIGESQFSGDQYNMYVGDYSDASLSNSDDDADNIVTSLPSYCVLYGSSLNYSSLDVTVVRAKAILISDSVMEVVTLNKLNLVNGSLESVNDIVVLSDSYVTDSTIDGKVFASFISNFPRLGNDSRGNAIPTIKFNYIYGGYNGGLTVSSKETKTVVFSSIKVQILSEFVVSRPSTQFGDVNASSSFIFALYNNASINISTNAIWKLYIDTTIIGDESSGPLVYNHGEIALLGRSEDQHTSDVDAYESSLGSLMSRLVVKGELTQYPSGICSVVLNKTYSNEPVILLSTNKSFGGAITVSFYIDTLSDTYPQLKLYDTSDVSTWPVVSFSNVESDSSAVPVFLADAPQGLQFTHSNSGNNASETTKWITINEISCDQISTYYYDVPESSVTNSLYPCYICLLNSSCNFCNNGVCGVAGHCNSGSLYTSNCCSGNCRAPYGSCQSNDNYMTFTCVCSSFFYFGESCDSLSISALIAIFAPGTIIMALGLTVYQLRKAYADVVSELSTVYVELVNLVVTSVGVTVFLFQILLAESSNRTVFVILALSRMPYLVGWLMIVKSLLFPSKWNTEEKTSQVDLAKLLHIPSFGRHTKIKVCGTYFLSPLIVPIYVALMIAAVFDLSLFKHLPWLRTKVTKLLSAYPSSYVFKCALYGNFLGNLLHLVGSALSKTETLTLAEYTLFVLYSGFMTLRGFVGLAFYMKLDHENDLSSAIVGTEELISMKRSLALTRESSSVKEVGLTQRKSDASAFSSQSNVALQDAQDLEVQDNSETKIVNNPLITKNSNNSVEDKSLRT